MAITTKEQLIGTWVFNSMSVVSFEGGKTFTIGFICDNKNYNSINGNVSPIEGLKVFYDSILVYSGHKDLGGFRWVEDKYKTIKITDVSNLTHELEFISFMNSNAVKQGGTTPEPQPLPLKAISLENLRTFKQECDKIYASASSITINQPNTATQGNLTQEDLTTLQANDQNYIIFANEIYRLQDKTHTSDTYTYAHVGYENGKHWVKTISITISTKAWVLNKVSIVGGA